MNKSTKPSVQQIVSDKLARLIKTAIEFEMPFRLTMQKSAMSNIAYTGINQFMLSFGQMVKGYESFCWMTSKQANSLGGNVKKGQRGEVIIYYLIKYKRGKGAVLNEKDFIKKYGEKPKQSEKAYMTLRYYTVFNVEQIENLPEKYYTMHKGEEGATSAERRENIDAFLNGLDSNINFTTGKAYYNPVNDDIHVPSIEEYKNGDAYYSVTFHELIHWTGHESRLNRNIKNTFGSKDYAKEELIAETGAAFLCGYFGIESTLQNSAAYLKNWLTALNNDEKFLFSAMPKAQKANDYLLNLSKQKLPMLEAA